MELREIIFSSSPSGCHSKKNLQHLSSAEELEYYFRAHPKIAGLTKLGQRLEQNEARRSIPFSMITSDVA